MARLFSSVNRWLVGIPINMFQVAAILPGAPALLGVMVLFSVLAAFLGQKAANELLPAEGSGSSMSTLQLPNALPQLKQESSLRKSREESDSCADTRC